MNLKSYYDSILKLITKLKRLGPQATISTRELLEEIDSITSSWEIAEGILSANGLDVSLEVVSTVDELRLYIGRSTRPRIKIITLLRKLALFLAPHALKERMAHGGLLIFDQNKDYSIYRYLKDAISAVTSRVWIIDAYLSDDTLRYLHPLSKTTEIRLISCKPPKKYETSWSEFLKVWIKFKKEHPKSNLRLNSNVHDRLLILDGLAMMSGPSIKDAGKKPSLIATFGKTDSQKAANFFDDFWKKSKTI